MELLNVNGRLCKLEHHTVNQGDVLEWAPGGSFLGFDCDMIDGMERVYIITHPEASHHADRLVGGWHNSHLTSHGLREAEQIAAHLRGSIPSDDAPQLVSSDLIRTRQTAEPIGAALGVQVTLEQGLREKSYGVAEGSPQSWLDAPFIIPPATGERLDHDEGIEGGETKRQWVERVYEAMARIQAERAEHRIIVTHAGTASWVVAAWMRMPVGACAFAHFRVPTGSITVLEEDDRFHNRALTVLGSRAFAAPT